MGPHVYLSRETGQPVVTADGQRIGRVLDLSVLLGAPHPVVRRVAVGSGRHLRHLVPWSVVRDLDEQALSLGVDSSALSQYAIQGDPVLEDNELLLCRDVLDTQVVDLPGRRLARVSDVLLVHRSDGQIEVAAVDVGMGSLLRRMGLGRLGALLSPAAVDWEDLHLTSGRGHVVQLGTSTAGMHRLDATGLADLLARLSTDRATDVMRAVGPVRSAGALHESHPVARRRLLHSLRHDEAQRVIDSAPRGVARLLAELRRSPPASRRRLRTAGWRLHRPPGSSLRRRGSGGDR